MLVREPGRPDQVREESLDGAASVVFYVSDDPGSVPPPPPQPRWAIDVAPTYRPDGLVAERPADAFVRFDDPLDGSYTWVAMLDPEELSHHVAVVDLHSAQRDGRETWWARVRALEGYEARCADCCDLLLGGAERGLEHLVGLDVATGVLVSLAAPDCEDRTWFIDNRILAVDDEVVLPA
jgi:hypothetical protein